MLHGLTNRSLRIVLLTFSIVSAASVVSYADDTVENLFHNDKPVPMDDRVCGAVKKVQGQMAASPLPKLPVNQRLLPPPRLKITPPVSGMICSRPSSVQPSPKALDDWLSTVAVPLSVIVVKAVPWSTIWTE